MMIYNETHCVYVHINKINGKKYVGQTIYGDRPKQRWSNGNGYKGSTYFYNAIQKYGWDNFDHEIVASNLTKEEADNFERLLIKELDTTNPNKGYNLESGWHKNKVLSVDTKQKLSETRKGLYVGENNPMYGISPKERMDEETYNSWLQQTRDRVTSEEFREKMRQINIGKKYSDETNAKKGKKGVEHPWYGRCHTDETKEKLRQANTGRKYSDEVNAKKSHKGATNPSAKAVEQYSKDGIFIKKWDYAKLAAETLGISLSGIIACCRGTNGRKTAGGFVWKYAIIETEGTLCVSSV